MDLEHLSKGQIVLLTLLVSFVTSIATGIVTVSLMDQAPPAIAQTVNRIIERTVEKVVPQGQAASTVVTQEKTVVVKESDLVAAAVEKVSPSIARLYTRDPESPVFLGLAVVLNASGTLVADTLALGDSGDANVALPDGTRVRAIVTARDNGNGLAFLQAATSTTVGDVQKPISWKPASLAAARPVLGATVIVLSGKTVARIEDGIVTALIAARQGTADVLDTNVNDDAVMRGSPLINIDGNVVGVSTEISRASSPTGFLSVAALFPDTSEAASER
ncbi:MAG: trypsin-like peptidase domain-containing protein [Candidatus Kaiserbacteria bacterium]|nr:MAG: trypsin-like peptidase domain-containing protein [Candidatus Kaiserbacteria bacterium]